MKTGLQVYQEEVAFLPTARLKRYQLLKGFTFLFTLWLTLPLALLSVLGEWAGVALVLIKNCTHAIQRNIASRFDWNEKAKERQQGTAHTDVINLSAYRSSRNAVAYLKDDTAPLEHQ